LLLPYRLNPAGQAVLWFLYLVAFAIVVGFRHEVGGDWVHYVEAFDYIQSLDFSEAIAFDDPGFYGAGWLIAHAGGNVYHLDFLCALIVMAGVVVFSRAQPMPWLAFIAAVPYLIIVVGMGYTRQATALGFALIGLAALGRERKLQFVVWVLIGALFHKSAVLLLPIAALSASRRRIWTWIWVSVTSAAGAILLVLDESDKLWKNYVEADAQSEGGLIRVAMNAVPAVLYLMFRRRLQDKEHDQNQKLWFWMSVFSLVCLPLVEISSTATDRVALYFIPVQLYVFSRLHRLASTQTGRTNIVLAVVAYYAAVQFVWLHYAQHAQFWVPYHFMPEQ
jgi:hypothetical protein